MRRFEGQATRVRLHRDRHQLAVHRTVIKLFAVTPPAGRIAALIRNLRPRVVILPYWEARHPDHYRASEIGFESCFLAGLKKLDEETPPHRPHKIIYSSLYANVTPSFVVDISAQFERRMSALFAYDSQYGEIADAADLFPQQKEIRERLAAIARFYGNLIGVQYGEPFVVKEAMRVDDITTMGVRSL